MIIFGFEPKAARLRAIADICSTLVILLSVALLVVWFAIDLEREYSGNAFVVDGDTLIINGEKIRLEGIDAPEFRQFCKNRRGDYQCGVKAKNHLKSLTEMGETSCVAWQRDKYERLLGHCINGKIDINSNMVSAGWAVAFGDYYTEEKEARKTGKGMWVGEFMRPREWRLQQSGS